MDEALTCVDASCYSSKSEGVRLVQDRETKLAALDAALARGMTDIEAGRTKPASEVFDRLEAKYLDMAKKAEQSARELSFLISLKTT